MERYIPWKGREALVGLPTGPATALVAKSKDPELAIAYSLFSSGDGNYAVMPPCPSDTVLPAVYSTKVE